MVPSLRFLLCSFRVGLTPNPDILCNRHIKFGAFLHEATTRLDADYIATGHYAQNVIGPGDLPALARGVDSNKDQAYFLAGMPADVLRRVMFPIGHLIKDEVKKMARERGYRDIADQKESMGICFIGKRKFRSFLQEYVVDRPGGRIILHEGSRPLVHPETHDGVHLFTLGQRASIGGMHQRCFVVGKDVRCNDLHIVRGNAHPALATATVLASDVRWTAGAPPPDGSRVCLQFRHRQQALDGTVYLPGATAPAETRQVSNVMGHIPGETKTKEWWPLHADECEVLLDVAAAAVTPGQAVVVYDATNHLCLGSGTITDTDIGTGAGYCNVES
jgi:tRNA-specific 2-thiouridylase